MLTNRLLAVLQSRNERIHIPFGDVSRYQLTLHESTSHQNLNPDSVDKQHYRNVGIHASVGLCSVIRWHSILVSPPSISAAIIEGERNDEMNPLSVTKARKTTLYIPGLRWYRRSKLPLQRIFLQLRIT